MRPSPLGRLSIALIVPVSLLAIWEVAVRLHVLPSSQAAAPTSVILTMVKLISSGALLRHALTSIYRIAAGLTIGTMSGVLSGVAIARSSIADRLLSPTIQLFAGIPVVVWIPFWVMLLGTDEAFKISMAAITTFFLVHLQTYTAVRGVGRPYLELAALYEKSHTEQLREVLLPSTAPAILTGVRTSLALCWVVVFFVEYASARYGSEGLGWFIADARQMGRIEQQFAGLLFLGFIAFAVDRVVGFVQTTLTRWTDVELH